ncbi:MAG: ion channel [Pseudomonadota bacterium]
MTLQILIGGTVILVCVVVQSAMVAASFAALSRSLPHSDHNGSIVRVSITIGAMTLWLMLVHATSICAWALTYRAFGVFGDWETSVYFSAVAFTTLGFGDVIPPREWRQLAGLCAAHGLLVFGVSSAALLEAFRTAFVARN